jgi:ribosomal protein L31E
MEARKRANKPLKQVDPQVLHNRVEKAVFILRKSLIIAMRQELVSIDQSLPINEHICKLEYALAMAFPQPEEKTSRASLPF